MVKTLGWFRAAMVALAAVVAGALAAVGAARAGELELANDDAIGLWAWDGRDFG